MRDMRWFINELDKKGLLVRVERPVNLRHEIGDICRAVNDEAGPALLFLNILEKPGTSVLCNIVGTPERVAFALGTTKKDVVRTYLERARKPIDPVITQGPAPCQQVVQTGDDVDLTKLPIPIWHPADAGPYITLGIQVSKDPETGVRNASILRQMVLGKNLLSLQILEGKHMYMHWLKVKQQGKPFMEAAIVIGMGPSVLFGGVHSGSLDEDEFAVAGGLEGEAVPMVKCKTVDLEVPADCEYVIEGIVPINEFHEEGPYGEFTGYYSKHNTNLPVMKVTAITSRTNPIYLGTYGGTAPYEEAYLRNVSYSTGILKDASRLCPGLIDLYVTPWGCSFYHAVAKIRKNQSGHARLAMNAIWACHLGKYLKELIVVDENIDITDPAQVEWAVATMVQPDRDILIQSRTPANVLDPSQWPRGKASTMGIDATKKTVEEGGPGVNNYPQVISHESSPFWKKIQERGWREYVA
jgi:UbiD family decarboxylase